MELARLRPLIGAIVLAVGALSAGGARAALIAHFDHSYGGGAVEIDLDVFDGQPLGRYLWQYTVTNISFNPVPGSSNGFSGFELFLPSPIAEIADITAPPPGIASPGWETNCCSGLPLEWDIRNSDGDGVMPGFSGVFSFTTDPRLVAINDRGWFHTWQGNSQTDIITTIGMHVPLVPGLVAIPAPGSLALLVMGAFALAWARRRLTVG